MTTLQKLLQGFSIVALCVYLSACSNDVPRDNGVVDNESSESGSTPSGEYRNELEPGDALVGQFRSRLQGELNYSVEQIPVHGRLELNQTNGRYTYFSDRFAEYDEFVILVKNNQQRKERFVVSIDFNDDTRPKILNSYPAKGAVQIPTELELSLEFDDLIRSDSISTNNGETRCIGSVQLSADNFNSCLPLRVKASGQQKRHFFMLEQALEKGIFYQLKVVDSIENYAGLTLANAELIHFQTSPAALLISEVGYNSSSGHRWFELHNASARHIDLSSYQLVAQAINERNQKRFDRKTFHLPGAAIAPGEYRVFQAARSNDPWWQQFHLVAKGNKLPYWDTEGFLALVDKQKDSIIDSVAFGDAKSETELESDGEDLPPLQLGSDGSTYHIARNEYQQQNKGAAWFVEGPISPGFPNDAQCLEDTDIDGIPDCNEQAGATFAGLDLYAMGARVGQRDVFIEIDYMSDAGAASIPRFEVLEKLRKVFAKEEIVLHFDVGNLYSNIAFEPEKFNLGGGNKIPFSQRVSFDWQDDANSHSFSKIKHQHFANARNNIFYYVVFAHTLNNDQISGRAEIVGTDSLITLGEWGLHTDTRSRLNRLINFQSVTLMHELGHNFGLRHGGFENTNFKPNYLSVMNYLYQLNGLATIGGNEGDRYYRYHFPNKSCMGGKGLENGPYGSYKKFRLDFSHGRANSLNPELINEAAGLGFSYSSGVDFNCDGDSDDMVVADAGETHHDHDDWANLRFIYAEKLRVLREPTKHTISKTVPSQEYAY